MAKRSKATTEDNAPRHLLELPLPVKPVEVPEATRARQLARYFTKVADALDGTLPASAIETFCVQDGRTLDDVMAAHRACVDAHWQIFLGVSAKSAKDRDPLILAAVDNVCRLEIATWAPRNGKPSGITNAVIGQLQTLLPDYADAIAANRQELETFIAAVMAGKAKRAGVTVPSAFEALAKALGIPTTYDSFARTRKRRKSRNPA